MVCHAMALGYAGNPSCVASEYGLSMNEVGGWRFAEIHKYRAKRMQNGMTRRARRPYHQSSDPPVTLGPVTLGLGLGLVVMVKPVTEEVFTVVI